jgi:hypothetical protein
MLAWQSQGHLQGANIAGDRQDDAEERMNNERQQQQQEQPGGDDIQRVIENIRGLVEGMENAPLDFQNQRRIQDVIRIFASARAGIVRDDAHMVVIDTPLAEMAGRYKFLKDYQRPATVQQRPTAIQPELQNTRETRRNTRLVLDEQVAATNAWNDRWRRLMVKVDGGNDGPTHWRGLNDKQREFFGMCRAHAEGLAAWRNRTGAMKPENLRLMIIGQFVVFCPSFLAQQYEVQIIISVYCYFLYHLFYWNFRCPRYWQDVYFGMLY